MLRNLPSLVFTLVLLSALLGSAYAQAPEAGPPPPDSPPAPDAAAPAPAPAPRRHQRQRQPPEPRRASPPTAPPSA
jgi:hypothetical protein